MVGVEINERVPELILAKEFPRLIRSKLMTFVLRGYRLAHELMRQTPFLHWAVGQDAAGYIRKVAVEFELKQLIDRGALEDNYKY